MRSTRAAPKRPLLDRQQTNLTLGNSGRFSNTNVCTLGTDATCNANPQMYANVGFCGMVGTGVGCRCVVPGFETDQRTGKCRPVGGPWCFDRRVITSPAA